jgi:hypothetical protein
VINWVRKTFNLPYVRLDSETRKLFFGSNLFVYVLVAMLVGATVMLWVTGMGHFTIALLVVSIMLTLMCVATVFAFPAFMIWSMYNAAASRKRQRLAIIRYNHRNYVNHGEGI